VAYEKTDPRSQQKQLLSVLCTDAWDSRLPAAVQAKQDDGRGTLLCPYTSPVSGEI